MNFFRKQTVGNVVFSLVLVVVGVLLMIYPEKTEEITCYCLGGVFAFIGLVKLFAYIITKKKYHDSDNIAEAICWAVIGLVLVIQSELLLSLYPIIVGLIIIIKNAFKLAECISYKKEGLSKLWFDYILIVIMISCGIVLCVLDTTKHSKFLTLFTAIVMILDGFMTVLLLFITESVKRAKKKQEKEQIEGEEVDHHEKHNKKHRKNDTKIKKIEQQNKIEMHDRIAEQEIIDVSIETKEE